MLSFDSWVKKYVANCFCFPPLFLATRSCENVVCESVSVLIHHRLLFLVVIKEHDLPWTRSGKYLSGAGLAVLYTELFSTTGQWSSLIHKQMEGFSFWQIVSSTLQPCIFLQSKSCLQHMPAAASITERKHNTASEFHMIGLSSPYFEQLPDSLAPLLSFVIYHLQSRQDLPILSLTQPSYGNNSILAYIHMEHLGSFVKRWSVDLPPKAEYDFADSLGGAW